MEIEVANDTVLDKLGDEKQSNNVHEQHWNFSNSQSKNT